MIATPTRRSQMNLGADLLAGVPPHRVARLHRQGERYFADGLRDLNADRRRAILAVCIIEWAAATADAVIEMHDRIVDRTWREAKQLHDARTGETRGAVTATLDRFAALGRSLLDAHGNGASLEDAVSRAPAARPLLDTVTTIAAKSELPATDDFLRPHSKWRLQQRVKGGDDARLREVAVMFHLRDALRSGDVWLERSHRYGDMRWSGLALNDTSTL